MRDWPSCALRSSRRWPSRSPADRHRNTSNPGRTSRVHEGEINLELVIVGLGRMGANMARRLHNAGHRVVAYNRSFEKTQEIMGEGLEGAEQPEQIVAMLAAPRVVWLMVPAGDPTEKTMEEFAALLGPRDTIVDGGNSNFKDSKRRHELLKRRGLHFVDAGISGGIWG